MSYDMTRIPIKMLVIVAKFVGSLKIVHVEGCMELVGNVQAR